MQTEQPQRWLCAGHLSYTRPSEVQEPRFKWVPVTDKRGRLSFVKQPIGDTPQQQRRQPCTTQWLTWNAALAALTTSPEFTDSPMRDRAHRKHQWVSAFEYTPSHSGGIRVTRWPMTTPRDMREWGLRMQQSTGMPYALRMNPRTGMTPVEAIETAGDIERDDALREHVQFVESKLLVH